MKKSVKIGLSLLGLGLATIAVTGCTANFCSDIDKARIVFALEPGVSQYYDFFDLTDEEIAAKQNDIEDELNKGTTLISAHTFYWEKAFGDDSLNKGLYRLVEQKGDNSFVKSSTLSSVYKTVVNATGVVPSNVYFSTIDRYVLSKALEAYIFAYPGEEISEATLTTEQANKVLTKFGYLKYYYDENNPDKALYDNFYDLHYQAVLELGVENCATTDFVKTYVSTLTSSISNNRSCISTFEVDDKGYAVYGNGNPDVEIEIKDWGYAWKKGFFEGLLVYPVSWMIDSFTQAFGGVSQNGIPQLLALALVTLIVRLFIYACTFSSTYQQQKMQMIQPELAKIQAKYPNANTSQAEKQRLAQEQQNLYKKHGIKPWTQFLVMIIQFPVFICVWGAMTGATVLSRGTFLGLNLSTSIMTALTNTSALPSNSTGWWTALVLIILMSVSQFLSMKLPQWIQKSRNKKIAKLGKNPAQTQQNRTMNIVSYVMLAFIIFMGFSLPAAMGVYWFLSAIISLGLNFLTQFIVSKTFKNGKNAKLKKHKK